MKRVARVCLGGEAYVELTAAQVASLVYDLLGSDGEGYVENVFSDGAGLRLAFERRPAVEVRRGARYLRREGSGDEVTVTDFTESIVNVESGGFQGSFHISRFLAEFTMVKP